MRKSRPKAKKSLSTMPHADTLRDFERDCQQKGVTPSERLRQILDEYYSNERLKSIRRDVTHSPIRQLQQEAISEELAPVKGKITEIEKTVQTVRSIVEDILGSIAQASLTSSNTLQADADGQVNRLELVVGELASYVERFSGCFDEAGITSEQAPIPLSAELAKELSVIKTLTANLAIRTLKETVRSLVQAEVESRHVVHVDWNPKTGIDVYAVREVVRKVTDPRTEIALEEATIRYGAGVRLGMRVRMDLVKRSDMVRLIAQAVNQLYQQE